MAAGWPVKTTYVNGDVYSASDVNDANGTLNYINPTSASDNQVLTRDNAATGKVKWAASATSTLTTTGDILYASSANTLARLGIGTANQVLTVSGGVPAWSSSSAYSSLASGSLSTSSSVLQLSSISGSYVDLYLIVRGLGSPNNGSITLTVNNITSANYTSTYILTSSTSNVNANTGTNLSVLNGVGSTNGLGEIVVKIQDYSNTVSSKSIEIMASNGSQQSQWTRGFCNATGAQTTAINRIDLTSGGGNWNSGSYVLYGVK